jgi:hypothetical protein
MRPADGECHAGVLSAPGDLDHRLRDGDIANVEAGLGQLVAEHAVAAPEVEDPRAGRQVRLLEQATGGQ